MVLLSSCGEEEPQPDEQDLSSTSVRSLMDNENGPSSNPTANNEDEECFTVVFPIDIIFPNGTTLTATSMEQLEDEVDAYYDNNPDESDDPRPVYPINVKLQDGTDQTISTDEEFEELLDSCDYNEDHDHEYGEEDIIICFEIDYPITIIFPDDSRKEISNDDELRATIIEWETTNTSDEDPTLDYPINITLEDGEAVTITNDDELEEAFDACYEGFDCEEEYEEECFDLNFPISIQLGGETITADNYDALDDAIDAWYEANPNSEEEPELVYPITITFEDGTNSTIASDEELDTALESCAD